MLCHGAPERHGRLPDSSGWVERVRPVGKKEQKKGITISYRVPEVLYIKGSFPYIKLPVLLITIPSLIYSFLIQRNMKQLKPIGILALLLVTGLFVWSQQPAVTASANKPSGKTGTGMKGAYELVRQVVNDGKKDSVMQIDQLKLYTDHYMIYAHQLPHDSLGDYGIGTYSYDKGKLTEHIFYTATGGEQKNSYDLEIRKSGHGYTQVIHFPADSQGVSYVLTEEYREVSKPVLSPLDGAWKQVRTSYIPQTGSPSENNHPTQFKVYQSGYYIWASTQDDSATHKPVSYYGYGTFDMKGPNRSTEKGIHSTFASSVVGTNIDLQLQFSGKDAYTQTIVWPNGDKLVEVYQRLKD